MAQAEGKQATTDVEEAAITSERAVQHGETEEKKGLGEKEKKKGLGEKGKNGEAGEDKRKGELEKGRADIEGGSVSKAQGRAVKQKVKVRNEWPV